MLEKIKDEGAIPFRYVAADSIYGGSPEFLKAVEMVPGVTYLVALPRDTLCWMQEPAILEKSYRYGGEKRTKRILAETEKKPITFEKIARGTNDYFWYRRTVSEGTKGPITYEFMKKRVVLAKDGQPDRVVWLIVRRGLGDGALYSYFISNAGRSTRLKTFVWLSGVRWAIEQCFEEAKSDLGMDHYEVRKFPGWRHHMLTCMLAHFFLWHMRIRLGGKSTSYYASQLRLLISVVLPIKTFDALDLIDLVSWIQVKNHRAYLSQETKAGCVGDFILCIVVGLVTIEEFKLSVILSVCSSDGYSSLSKSRRNMDGRNPRFFEAVPEQDLVLVPLVLFELTVTVPP